MKPEKISQAFDRLLKTIHKENSLVYVLVEHWVNKESWGRKRVFFPIFMKGDDDKKLIAAKNKYYCFTSIYDLDDFNSSNRWDCKKCKNNQEITERNIQCVIGKCYFERYFFADQGFSKFVYDLSSHDKKGRKILLVYSTQEENDSGVDDSLVDVMKTIARLLLNYLEEKQIENLEDSLKEGGAEESESADAPGPAKIIEHMLDNITDNIIDPPFSPVIYSSAQYNAKLGNSSEDDFTSLNILSWNCELKGTVSTNSNRSVKTSMLEKWDSKENGCDYIECTSAKDDNLTYEERIYNKCFTDYACCLREPEEGDAYRWWLFARHNTPKGTTFKKSSSHKSKSLETFIEEYPPIVEDMLVTFWLVYKNKSEDEKIFICAKPGDKKIAKEFIKKMLAGDGSKDLKVQKKSYDNFKIQYTQPPRSEETHIDSSINLDKLLKKYDSYMSDKCPADPGMVFVKSFMIATKNWFTEEPPVKHDYGSPKKHEQKKHQEAMCKVFNCLQEKKNTFWSNTWKKNDDDDSTYTTQEWVHDAVKSLCDYLRNKRNLSLAAVYLVFMETSAEDKSLYDLLINFLSKEEFKNTSKPTDYSVLLPCPKTPKDGKNSQLGEKVIAELYNFFSIINTLKNDNTGAIRSVAYSHNGTLEISLTWEEEYKKGFTKKIHNHLASISGTGTKRLGNLSSSLIKFTLASLACEDGFGSPGGIIFKNGILKIYGTKYEE